MNYPEVVDYAPLHINAQALRKAIAKYDDPKMETVAFAIASYADPHGVAFPGLDLLARITGYTVQEVSRYAHWLQAAGVFVICHVKAKGAQYAHNVYKFAKSFIRRVADVTSAHFIANVKKWRAEGKDVAQAIKKRARKSIDDLTAKAEKMAALFQERPDLMDNPEKAAELAGVADNPSVSDVPAVSDVSDVTLEPVPSETPAPVHIAPITWENGESWDDAPTAPPAPTATARIAALFGIPEPSHLEKTSTPAPFTPNLSDEPLPLYYQEQTAPATDHSWRDNVPGYQENAATV